MRAQGKKSKWQQNPSALDDGENSKKHTSKFPTLKGEWNPYQTQLPQDTPDVSRATHAATGAHPREKTNKQKLADSVNLI